MTETQYKIFRLGDICEKIGSGATPTGGKEAYHSSGTSLIRSQNVYNDGFRKNGLAFIDEKQAHSLDNVIVQRNDVLLNITGDSVARVCQVPDDVLPARVNQHVAIIRTNPTILESQYLRYYLAEESFQQNLLALASAGATRNALTKGMIESLEISLPPLPTQHAIARILGSLDNKIELNRQMNETLEAMARAIFQSWFVDFDPVRAKAEGRDTGLPPEIAALFPDGFEEVDGREVPRGWHVAILGDYINVVKGLSYKGEGLCDDGIPLHNLNSVLEGGGYKYKGIKFYNGEYQERHLIQPGDIIVTNTEQGFGFLLIGYPAIVPKYYHGTGLFTHHIFRVRPSENSPLTNHFIYSLLMIPFVREQVIGCTNGTTVNMLYTDGLKTPQFLLPSKEIIQLFEKVVGPIYEIMENNEQQSRLLAQIRDALLPRLMTGEILPV